MSVTDFYDIIKVLMELPGCVPYYAIDTSIAIGKTVLPSGLKVSLDGVFMDYKSINIFLGSCFNTYRI